MNKRRIKELKIDYLSPVLEGISLEKAWDCMIKNKVKALPVVDEEQNYIGMVTIEGITKAYTKGINKDIYDLKIPLENIIDTLRGTITGKKVKKIKLKDVKIQSLKDEELVNIGNEQVTITTPYHQKTVQRIMIRAVPIKYILESEDMTVGIKEDARKAEKKIRETNARYFAVLSQENEPVGVIEREELLYQYQSKRKVKKAI